jgi:DNA-binding transcriptional ArsR family regulator
MPYAGRMPDETLITPDPQPTSRGVSDGVVGGTGATQLADARALRALAHPARLAILERLQDRGPATATECADVTGLSPSACSYHLRALQKHGLVRDSRPRSDGRERVWEAVGRGFEWDPGADDDEQLAAAGAVLVDSLLQRSDARVHAYFGGDSDEPHEWREAAHVENATLRLTTGELLMLTQTIDGLLERYRARTRDADEAPSEARLVHAAVRFVPQLAAEPMLTEPDFIADASEPDPRSDTADRSPAR